MEIRRLHDEIDTLKKDTFGEKESDSFLLLVIIEEGFTTEIRNK